MLILLKIYNLLNLLYLLVASFYWGLIGGYIMKNISTWILEALTQVAKCSVFKGITHYEFI